MINSIVNKINETIIEQYQCITGDNSDLRYFGLAHPVQITERGSDKSIPAIIANDGECYYVFLDDDFPFGLYHRLVQRNYGKAKGCGDEDVDVRIDDIILIVWGFSDKLNMQAIEVEERIIIPSLPKEAQLVSSNFDSYNVIRSEFRNVNYLNRPEEFIFSVKYKVQYKFRRECVLKTNCK